MNDPVNHPEHYTSGRVECITAIEAVLGDGFVDYCKGNAMKYVWRSSLKGKEIEDLRKAAWYCNRAVHYIIMNNKDKDNERY